MTRFLTLLAVCVPAFVTSAWAADVLPMQEVSLGEVNSNRWDWTGFYAGLHAGYGWAEQDTTLLDPFDDLSFDGALAGGQVGVNYEIGNLVVGVEGDLSLADMDGQISEVSFFSGDEGSFTTEFNSETSIEWMGTVRGRLGVTWDRFMLYGTGGAAFARTQLDFERIGPAARDLDVNEETRWGWVAGLGAEALVTPNISIRGEYLRAEFESVDFSAEALLITDSIGFIELEGESDLSLDVLRGAVSVKF